MKNAYLYFIERILPSRISYRLALSYLLILCLFIIVVVRSVTQVQDVSRRSQEFASQDLQKLLQENIHPKFQIRYDRHGNILWNLF